MKKLLSLAVCVLLPLVVMAGVFGTSGAQRLSFWGNAGIGFRETQRIQSLYNDESWNPENRTHFVYSQDHPERLTQVLMDIWEDGNWIEGTMLADLEYNSQGRVISLEVYGYFMDIEYPILKQISEYDSQRRLICNTMFQNSDFKNAEWEPSHRMSFIYSGDNIAHIYEWYNAGDEESEYPYYHSVPEYDAEGRMIQTRSYASLDSLNWQLDSKTVNVYHPDDTSTGADLVENIAHFMPLTFLYEDLNLFGTVLSETEYLPAGSDWEEGTRTIWQYNNLLNPTHRRIDYFAGTWEPAFRKSYYYDPDNRLQTIVREDYYHNSYHLREKLEFTWEQYSSNSDFVAPLPRLDFRVQPNPFGDKLRVEADTRKNAPLILEVYNLRGQKLYHTTVNSNEFEWNGVDLQGKTLPAGIYFMRLSQDGISGTKRVLKLK